MIQLPKLFDRLSKYCNDPSEPKLGVRVDITNKCNLMCPMCHYPFTVKERKFDMDPELFRKIVDEVFPHAEWVSLACQYEAFMSRHIEQIFEMCAEGPCRLIGIVTNATLWNERRINMMLQNPVIRSIGVSIDGGSKATYEKFRLKANWDKFIANLDLFAEMRDKLEDPPELVLNTVLMTSTVHELPLLAELAVRLKAARLQCLRFLPINGDMVPEVINDWEAVMPLLVEAKRIAHDGGVELLLPIEDERLNFAEDTEREKTCNTNEIGRFSNYCEAPWTGVQIQPNGDVHPCGWYGKSFGSLKENSFLEIWNNDKYLDLRRSLATERVHEKCRLCNPHGYDRLEKKKRINVISK